MVNGWALTTRGIPLTQIHNESDLMVAEVLGAGILGGLSAPMIAAVLSCLTYRKRGPGDPSTVRLGGDFPYIVHMCAKCQTIVGKRFSVFV